MKERFEGEDGLRRLIDCLLRQQIVRADHSLAKAIADLAELVALTSGEVLIEQGGTDNSVFFILSGRVKVEVNGREVAVRESRQHVGDLALIDPSARRSATVTALAPSVFAKLSETDFTRLAEEQSELWRRIALELGDRIRQRGERIVPPNPRPVVFIGSSVESLDVARAVRDHLEHDDFLVKVWTDGGVFGASRFPIEDLLTNVEEADVAVLVLSPDDRVRSREQEVDAPRDNVIFELGLFMGSLGRRRTILLVPRDQDIKIPTDLLGLTPITYKLQSRDTLPHALSSAANAVRNLVNHVGVK